NLTGIRLESDRRASSRSAEGIHERPQSSDLGPSCGRITKLSIEEPEETITSDHLWRSGGTQRAHELPQFSAESCGPRASRDGPDHPHHRGSQVRSEEHTSELQSR